MSLPLHPKLLIWQDLALPGQDQVIQNFTFTENNTLHAWRQSYGKIPRKKKYGKNGNFIHFCRSIFYQGGGDTPTGAGKVVHNLQEKERGIMHASILAYYRISHSKWTSTLSQLSSNSTSIPSYENGKASSKIWSAALYYFVQQEGFIM